MSDGASAEPTGLSQVEPVSRLDPTGFDPLRDGQKLVSRVEHVLVEAALARRLNSLSANYKNAEAAVAKMRGAEKTLLKVFEEMDGFRVLKSLQAIAMEARSGETAKQGSTRKGDSAAIAQD